MSYGPVIELPPRKRRAILSLAPLVDATFILLIFFMLVTQFDRYGTIGVSISESRITEQEAALREQGAASRSLTILLQADGMLLFGGEAVPLGSLSRRIASFDEAGNAGILLKPEADVPLQILIDVLTAVRTEAGRNVQIIMPPAAERWGPR